MHDYNQFYAELVKVSPVALLVCLILAAGGVSARAQQTDASGGVASNGRDFVTALTKENIAAFLQEVKEIGTGQRSEMMPEDIKTYFTNHISEKAQFKSKLHYDVPGFPAEPIDAGLNKGEYINGILSGRGLILDYQAQIDIKDMKLSDGGRRVALRTLTKERGRLPLPGSENETDAEKKDPIPIEGESDCQQTLIVSFANYIQMVKADCVTDIRFLPFEENPLDPSQPGFESAADAASPQASETAASPPLFQSPGVVIKPEISATSSGPVTAQTPAH